MSTDFKSAVLIALWMIVMYKTGYAEKEPAGQPFKQYQYLDTLPPDMVHADTLRVMDADYLNAMMPKISGSNDDIKELLNETCVPLSGTWYFNKGDSIFPDDDFFFMKDCKDTLIVKYPAEINEVMGGMEATFPNHEQKASVYLHLIKMCCYDHN